MIVIWEIEEEEIEISVFIVRRTITGGDDKSDLLKITS